MGFPALPLAATWEQESSPGSARSPESSPGGFRKLIKLNKPMILPQLFSPMIFPERPIAANPTVVQSHDPPKKLPASLQTLQVFSPMILPKTPVVYIWPAGGAQAPGSPSQVGGVLASRGVGAPEDVRPPRGTCAPILCLGLPLAVLGLPLAVPKMFRAALGGPRAALGGLGLPLAVP